MSDTASSAASTSPMLRTAQITRTTAETDISLSLNVDGSGISRINTGVAFFDHMLTLLAKHALFDLEVKVKGDIEVDFHHTVEDTGIALGQALHKALGDKAGLRRYGFAYLPMDETLVRVALDFSGRPYVVFRVPPGIPMISLRAGNFPAQLTEEFLRGLSQQAGLTLHVEVLYSSEPHHLIEAVFKGLAKALDSAVTRDARVKGIPSTKGML
ncbi:MAG TPA: imidazoleglycerol-phosphate dehydratase HisB [Candidatus Methylacidiphilales bacterium]|nr:imidazoleglycerol-phosphate dehydratase HisB [Candidatus Methylacidiphilales bacterium]